MKEKEVLNQLTLRRKSVELQYESIQNRLNYIPEFLSKKLVQIHSSIVDSTAKIDGCHTFLLENELEKEKLLLEKRKKEFKEKFQRKEMAAEAKLRQLKDELREEEQSLGLILACVDGIRKKNAENRESFIRQPHAPPTLEDIEIPTQGILYFDEEEKHPILATKSTNSTNRQSQYDAPQQQPPWFRMVKRRKVIDEYLTTREYKSATQILVEKEHEWSEVRYSSE